MPHRKVSGCRPSPPNGKRIPPGRFREVLWRGIAAAASPVEVFRQLSLIGQDAALLYSAEGFGKTGSTTYIALDPVARLSVSRAEEIGPFAALEGALARCTWSGADRPPLGFFGGWVGFLSYDLVRSIETIPLLTRRDLDFPLLRFTLYQTVLAYDACQEKWTVCTLVAEGEERSVAEARLEHAEQSLMHPPSTREEGPPLQGRLQSNFTKEAYEQAVAAALEYIAAGDIYQVNLSQRFSGELAIGVSELAARLMEASPAPFAACLMWKDQAILSSSPERFLLVEDTTVTTWPIKGTRPRGATKEEDRRLVAELMDSAKEKAELTMITDLLRNDLGRVCVYGSVRVPHARLLESFEHVHHTRSTVQGELRGDVSLCDLLRATLPGGSVTGAPKIRACEIIEELEPTARGPYCGAIGYIGVDGRMDLNIAIRTMLVQGSRVTFQVGGGIVADSDPRMEYEETLHKARGMMRTLQIAPDDWLE